MRFEIACGADGPPKGIRLEPEEDFPVRPIFVPVLRWNRGVSPPTALAHLVLRQHRGVIPPPLWQRRSAVGVFDPTPWSRAAGSLRTWGVRWPLRLWSV